MLSHSVALPPLITGEAGNTAGGEQGTKGGFGEEGVSENAGSGAGIAGTLGPGLAAAAAAGDSEAVDAGGQGPRSTGGERKPAAHKRGREDCGAGWATRGSKAARSQSEVCNGSVNGAADKALQNAGPSTPPKEAAGVGEAEAGEGDGNQGQQNASEDAGDESRLLMKELPVHAVILAAQSDYFAAAFGGGFKEGCGKKHMDIFLEHEGRLASDLHSHAGTLSPKLVGRLCRLDPVLCMMCQVCAREPPTVEGRYELEQSSVSSFNGVLHVGDWRICIKADVRLILVPVAVQSWMPFWGWCTSCTVAQCGPTRTTLPRNWVPKTS